MKTNSIVAVWNINVLNFDNVKLALTEMGRKRKEAMWSNGLILQGGETRDTKLMNQGMKV